MTALPGTIDSTGSSDVAADLTAWFANTANYPDGEVTFAQNGIYRIDDGNVEIDNANGLVIDGNGATLHRTRVPDARYTNHSSALWLTSAATDVTIRNLKTYGVNRADIGWLDTWADTVVGDTAYFLRDDTGTNASADPPGFTDVENASWGCYCLAMAFDHAIEIENATRVVVEDCELIGPFGDGILFAPECDQVIVRRNTVDRCGRQGIAFVAGHDILVTDNTFLHCRQAGIDLECDSSTQKIFNVEIRNNYFNSWLTSFASIGPGAVDDVHYHDNTVWRNCLIVGTNNGAIRRRRWRIEDNTLQQQVIDTAGGWSSPQGLFSLKAYTDVSIRRNRAAFVEGHVGPAVSLTNSCSNVVVEDNHMEGIPDMVFGSASNPLSQWTETNNSDTGTAPTVTRITALDDLGATDGDSQNIGGAIYRFNGTSWKFVGYEFRRFTPLVDWTV